MSIRDARAIDGESVAGDWVDLARRRFDAERDALTTLRDTLDARLLVAVDRIAHCSGRVVLSGIGKSAIAGRKIASTLCSLGTPAQFLHAADALHGDLGAVAGVDVLIAISVSGETRELIPAIEHVQRRHVFVVAISAHAP